jgi:hypothetical protein
MFYVSGGSHGGWGDGGEGGDGGLLAGYTSLSLFLFLSVDSGAIKAREPEWRQV